MRAKMEAARLHMQEGKSQAEAARLVGLTRSALSQDKVCRELTQQQKDRKGRSVDKLVREGFTWREACEKVGVPQSTYSRYLKRKQENF